MDVVTVEECEAAAARIVGTAIHTPLIPVETSPAKAGTSLWLKLENLQPIGAFKIRGAANAIAQLTPEQARTGVITHSSGNHGQALAYVGHRASIPVTVVIPHSAPSVKKDACRRWGAHVVEVEPEDRVPRMQALAAEHGYTQIPPYDDKNIIAGQGTIGLEIAHDAPGTTTVLVPVSGGGILSGIAVAIKALLPAARVVGVEPEVAADAWESKRAGTRVSWPVQDRQRTIADGLRAELSELTWHHVREYVDEIVTVTEKQIESAVVWLAQNGRIVAEPSGAVTTAGYLHTDCAQGQTVAVVSGGNVDPHWYGSLLQKN